jgi:hypothetical protein
MVQFFAAVGELRDSRRFLQRRESVLESGIQKPGIEENAGLRQFVAAVKT